MSDSEEYYTAEDDSIKCANEDSSESKKKKIYRRQRGPSNCSTCGLTCRTRTALKYHILEEHSILDVYKCPDCPHLCQTRNAFRKHVKRQHNRSDVDVSNFKLPSKC
jgi:hypothetical protein